MGVTVVAHAEATPPESRIVPLRLFVRQGNIAMLVVGSFANGTVNRERKYSRCQAPTQPVK